MYEARYRVTNHGDADVSGAHASHIPALDCDLLTACARVAELSQSSVTSRAQRRCDLSTRTVDRAIVLPWVRHRSVIVLPPSPLRATARQAETLRSQPRVPILRAYPVHVGGGIRLM